MAPNGTDPSLEELKANWGRHIPTLEGLAKQYKKPVIFTELGYVSAKNAFVAPNKVLRVVRARRGAMCKRACVCAW